jgi:hypothetical protein
MTRSYARIMTAIWQQESRFRALTANAQRTFMLLITQPDISAAGVLPLTVRRWAAMASDTDARGIGEALKELVEADFVAADRESEELLIRSFVYWDGGANNPKRRPVIIRAALDVSSATLRELLDRELAELGLPTDGLSNHRADRPPPRLRDRHPHSLSDRPSDRHPDSLSDSLSTPASLMAIDAAVAGAVITVKPQENRLSGSLSGCLSDRASDRASDRRLDSLSPRSSHQSQPQPTTPTLPPTAESAQALVGEWIGECQKRPPKAVVGQIAKHVKSLLGEGIEAADVRSGLRSWARRGLHPATLPSVVNEQMNPRSGPSASDATILSLTGQGKLA